MDRLFIFIATGGGAGYLPRAPGTWGSLAGIFLWLLLLRWLPPAWYWGLVAFLFVIGTIAAGAAEKILDRGDPSQVVIDEIVGQLITLAGADWHPAWVIAGFALFRLFDISKPFPVGWLDKHLHGGMGIMLDDVAAGCSGLLLLQMARFWLT